MGRWITLDPAKDGLNWYVYANNNPLAYIDPDGKRTYFVNGIGNRMAVGPPQYAYRFQRELIERNIHDVRLFGVYNRGWTFVVDIEGAYKVAKEWINLDAYSLALAEQVKADLKKEPLAKGEELNFIGYSGGGQIVLNAAEKLEGTVSVNNVILIGAPVQEVQVSNIDNVTVIFAAFDLLWRWWFFWDFEFAGWYGHTGYWKEGNIDEVADIVDEKIN